VAIVKQGQENSHAMMVSDTKEVVNSFGKSIRVVVPDQIVQIDPQRIEPEVLSPAQFSVDCFSVVCVCLPHFQLVNRGAWQEVTAHKPRLCAVPILCLISSPFHLFLLLKTKNGTILSHTT